MNKKELETRLGGFVEFSYGTKGTYIGRLIDVATGDSKVKVMSLKKYPSIDLKDTLPLKEGTELSVGNRNIKEHTGQVIPYARSLAEVFNAQFNHIWNQMCYYKAHPEVYRAKEMLESFEQQYKIIQEHKKVLNPYCN